MIKNVLFDLDDTLFDFHKAERNALKKTLLKLGITPTEELLSRYSEINLAQWKLLEKGLLTRAEVKTRRYFILFKEFGIDASETDAAKYYENFLSIGHIFIPGAKKLIENLYGKYRLYIVSNGTAVVQDGRIKSSGIAKYFDGIFISEKIGFNKPDKEFFDVCFSKIPDFSEKETVIVGDSLTSDIAGGKNVGIITIWFNGGHNINDGDIVPDYEIFSLSDVQSIIESVV